MNNIESIENKYSDLLVWKYNSSLLYEYACMNRLKTPSLSMEWLTKTYSAGAFERQFCILGTYYRQREKTKNMLKVCSMPIPPKKPLSDVAGDYIFQRRPKGENGTYEGFAIPGCEEKLDYQVKNEHIMTHSAGEPNSIRVRPTDDQNLVATSTEDGVVRLFKLWEDGQNPDADFKEYLNEIHCFDNNCNEISWLNWNKIKSNLLLASGLDTYCQAIDVENNKVTKFDVGNSVNSCIWIGPEIICSVDEAGYVKVFDLRANHQTPDMTIFTGAHKDPEHIPINTVDMHPTFNSILATGGLSNMVELIDMRTPHRDIIHVLDGHKQGIQQLSFHQTLSNTIVSFDNSNSVLIWDLTNIGMEQSCIDQLDGIPELIFTHCGHGDEVFDVRWNPLGPERGYNYWLGSTAKDYTIQSYIPRESVMDVTSTGFEDTLKKIENYDDYISIWKKIYSC